MGNITYNEIEQIKEIKHGLIKDLIEIGQQNGKLQEIDTLAHAIKNLCKVVEDAEENMEGGYSGRRGYSNNYMMPDYRDGWSMNPYYANEMNYSQARGRGPGARRDSMGRYSSHEDGNYISSLYTALNYAKSDSERQSIQDMINRAQQNM